MNATPTAPWIYEHGEEFDVPPFILRIKDIIDFSWHNDVCPRFAFSDDEDAPSLWVDHPEADERELGPETPRYKVIMGDEVLYAGDSMLRASVVMSRARKAFEAQS